MSAGQPEHIIRASGRVIVGPTDDFATGTFPYGGTQVGRVKQVRMRSLGTSKLIWDEGLGAVKDVGAPTNRWVISLLVRGWNPDAITQFYPGNREEGEITKHSVFRVPGTRIPGQSGGDSINIAVAFVPDNLLFANGFIAYRCIPDFDEAGELAFDRREEQVIHLTLECLLNGSGNILEVGRMPDLNRAGT